MVSAKTWERIERQKLRGRERRARHHRPGDRPDPSRPAGTDLLPQIRHIVVLMVENHSFDNYLGTLGRGEGFPAGDDGRPDAENPDSAGTMIRAHHATSTGQQEGVPCQSWSASHAQWAGGTMNGFVTSAERAAPEGGKAAPMAYWTGQDLPFYHGLARTFPLADRWFSSCLGPTFPNRRFLLAGTANGLMDDLPLSLLKVLFPGYVRHARQLVAGPDAYDTYGFRVPAVIVSPYARPDCVLSDIFDHTSVLKLLQEKWNLPALTRRDAAATSPLGALDLTAPPAFLTPPELPAPARAWGTW